MAAPNYRALARAYARKFGIDPGVFERQIGLESGFNPKAVSPAGAEGIAQFMPGTAKSRGVNPWDPRSALAGAAKLDADLIHQTGSYRQALAAYNAGPGNIPAGLGYADKILRGRSPSSSGAGAAGGGTPATTTTPGVDRSGDRRAVLLNWLLTQSKGPQAGLNLTGAIQQIHALGDTPPRTVSTSSGPSASPSSVGADTTSTGGSPLAKLGKIIGVPYQGTHTLGNWQSDNAVDISVPVGTPVYANASGTITRAGPLSGQSQSSGNRFAGNRVQIGDEAWYGHLSRLTVKEGERVKKGQLIGYSGAANGVAHLHFAVHNGDPRRYLR